MRQNGAVTNEQGPDESDASEPTENLGELGAAPPEPGVEDTARLWPQEASAGEPYPAYAHEQSYDTQQPYPYAGYPAYQHVPPTGLTSGPGTSEPLERSRARVPGWLWPVVAATALIVGTIGGAIGGTIVAGNDTSGFYESAEEPGQIDGPSSSAPLPTDNGSIAEVAEQLLPSTVQVNANGGSGSGTGATGSGFVVDDKGHVITNNHVVADATGEDQLEVVDHRGRPHAARIIGRSPVYDIAVLAIDNYEGLQPAAIGSSRAMRIGDTVVAIGSPLGLSSTVTSGIVSALDRPVTTGGESGDSSYINAVQTDAAINPGNSGGPLVNLRGQVVGVNSAIATTGGIVDGDAGNIGVGFAIPMEQVRVTANQILETGEALYPVIGANVNTVPDKKGANIVEVNDGTPAEQAGLRKDDLVVAVNGKSVADSIGLIVAIRAHQPGETITLTYIRGGTRGHLDVTLEGQPDRP
jgi:putative serine protease PepD